MQLQPYICTGKHITPAEQAKCPVCARKGALFKVQNTLQKEDFFGSSPAPFIGRYGYPDVNVGILSPPQREEEAWKYNAPKHWASQGYQISDVVDLRAGLINSRTKANIKNPSKMVEVSQEVGMSSSPVDVEVHLQKRPTFQMNFTSFNAPMGPQAEIKSLQVTENPKIHTKVDKVVSDTDMKATEAVTYLYHNEFDETFLTNLLSVGTVGIKENRKLVPTRWSITAVDDILGNDIRRSLIDKPQVEFQSYFEGYLGNEYLVLFFPGEWSYELYEMFITKPGQKLRYGTDHEWVNGRTSYAENTVGGYYAARLAILEKMKKMGKVGKVLALRFISEEYTVPLGVWVVREASRKSMTANPLTFSDKDLLIQYARSFAKKKYGMNIDEILKGSLLLKEMKTQKKLGEWF